MIRFVCGCGRQLQARDEDVGKKAKCPSCAKVMSVPNANTKKAARPPAPAEREAREDRDRPRRREREEDDDYYDDDDRDYDAPEKTSIQAITSVVLGVLALCLPVLPALFGIFFGIMGLRSISSSRGRLGGRGLAIAGLVTSCLSFVLLPPYVMLWQVVFPNIEKVREADARLKDQENLKKIVNAFYEFNDRYDRLPQATAYLDKRGGPGLSWRVALLPFLGHFDLYSRFNRDEPWDSPHNIRLLADMPPVYLMPDQTPDGTGKTYYQVFVGKDTIFEAVSQAQKGVDGVQLGLRLSDVTDGVANTILVTTGRNSVPWTKPDDLAYDPNGQLPVLGDRIPGGCQAAFGDGTVRFLSHRSLEALKAYITRNGGEVVAPP